MCNRMGLGRMKHIEVEDLWLQGAVKDKRISLHKIGRAKNVSDMMTKIVSRTEAETQMHMMGLETGGSRPKAAPTLAGSGSDF